MAGKSRDYRDVIVFEKLHSVHFCPFSNPSGLKVCPHNLGRHLARPHARAY